MKKIIVSFICLMSVLSCTNHRSSLTDAEWFQDIYIYKLGNISDTIASKVRLKFTETDTIYFNKYNPNAIYKIEKNQIKIINSVNSSINTTWQIVENEENKYKLVISESNDPVYEINSNDKIEMVLTKTDQAIKKPYDKALYNLGKMFDIGMGEEMADGRVFYLFDCMNRGNSSEYLNPYPLEAKVKGSIDKAIGALPTRETLEKYSHWQKSIMNMYEWETLDYQLTLEDFYKSTPDSINFLQVKIWITEK